MFDIQQLQKGIPETAPLTAAQETRKLLSAFRCMVLGMFLFFGSLDAAAQDVIVAGSEPGRSMKKNPPVPKPVQAKKDIYFDVRIVPDEDCIITIDGVKQKDTLRAGKATSKKLSSGTHRLGAESIATGYVHNQQLKVDAVAQKAFVIPLKEQFEQHIKKVEAALSQQQ